VKNYKATARKQNMVLSIAMLFIIAGLFYQGVYFVQQNYKKVSWEK